MRISIYPLGSANAVRELLVEDGWRTEFAAGDCIEATHPHVANEEQARERLYPLGLLTTGTVRIEWEPCVLAESR